MEKENHKKFLTVYTTSFTERAGNEIIGHVVSGSFIHRGDAIRECAYDVIFYVVARPAMKSLFVNDERVRKTLKDSGMPANMIDGLLDPVAGGEIELMDKAADAIKEMIIDEIGGQGCIVFRSDLAEFRFEIDENDIECPDGLQTWTCITSGVDSDNHDPEWEQAFPEVFLSEEEAVDCALKDLRQCLEGSDRVREIMKEARKCITYGGWYEYELNDSTTRRWDVWSTPIDVGQGRDHVKRPRSDNAEA